MINKEKLKKDEFKLLSFSNDEITDLVNKGLKSELVKEHIASSIITNEERDFYNSFSEWLQVERSGSVETIFRYHTIEKKLAKEKESGKLTKPQANRVYDKLMYLIHIIAYYSYTPKLDYIDKKYHKSKPCPQFRMSADILSDIIGDDYYNFISTLWGIRLITGATDYVMNEDMITYYINPKFYKNIIQITTKNIKIQDDITQTIQLIRKRKYLDNPFYNRYNNILSRISLLDIEGANNFLNSKIKNLSNKDEDFISSYYTKMYNQYIDYNKDNYRTLSIDKNKRIYHILTNTNRDFRQYINIKFMIDICNSHPLLLNKLLIEHYNINDYIYNIIINIKYNKVEGFSFYQLLPQKSLKLLIDKIIEEKDVSIDKSLLDVYEYIIMTSGGHLWHGLLDKCRELGLDMVDGVQMDKHLLKEHIFGEVYYSNIVKTIFYITDKETKVREKITKHYAIMFKSMYPNVFKVINKNKPKEDRTQLSNALMKEEAKLFHEILQRLYVNDDLDAINIHDAIVVLTTSDEKYTVDYIESIMKDVYNENNLFPTFEIKQYNRK